MLEQLTSILRDECLVEPPATIVVGVSGGPDSLCLMDVLHGSGYHLLVAHFNHQLRAEADSEALAVEAAAARISAPYVWDTGDVRSLAGAHGLSIEEAARQLRYAFLFAQAREHHARAVAVGHTADDQVETVLMHFIRGAGLDGLRGMSYRTILPGFDPEIPLIRPLLDVWREEILDYCDAHALPAQHDSSNESLDFLRNRLRHELIPALETYNPRFRLAVWRTARTLSTDQALLNERLAVEWERALVRLTDDCVALDAAYLTQVSPAIQMHLIRLAAKHLAPGAETTYAVLDRAARFLADTSAVRKELIDGLELFREAAFIYVSRGESGLPSDAWPQMPTDADAIPVTSGGRAALAGGWQFESQRSQPVDLTGSETARSPDRFAVWLDADHLPENVELRAGRPGDRFEPLGMQGHSQKMSDFFVNVKLAARARRRWPLLCSGDCVIWVPGYRPADSFKLRPSTRHAIRFVISRVG